MTGTLDALRADYEEVTGQQFDHFYCPMLFRDEAVERCEAHIVNQAFPNSTRATIVQRKDIDGFYGSRFEAEFVQLRLTEQFSFVEAFTSKDVSRVAKPRVIVDGREIDSFFAGDGMPAHFSRIQLKDKGSQVELGLKLCPEELESSLDRDWSIRISVDIRLPSVVSLIKSAHLSLFRLLGYRYVLSGGGQFVGRCILGEFYLKNHTKTKPDVLKVAKSFFRSYAHMVRPVEVESGGQELAGTTDDGYLYVCVNAANWPWALIVLVRTSPEALHAVMIPVFEGANAVASMETFMSFLENENESLEVRFCRFEQDSKWHCSEQVTRFRWPKDGTIVFWMFCGSGLMDASQLALGGDLQRRHDA